MSALLLLSSTLTNVLLIILYLDSIETNKLLMKELLHQREVTEKKLLELVEIKDMGLCPSVDSNLVFNVIVLVVGVLFVYNSYYLVSDSSFRLSGLIDTKLSEFLNCFNGHTQIIEFTDPSGYQTLIKKSGESCMIYFKGPNDGVYRTLSSLLENLESSSTTLTIIPESTMINQSLISFFS